MCSWGAYITSGKKYTESRNVLEEALQINPFNPAIFRMLSEAYAALGEPEKAKQAKVTLDKLMTAQ